MARNCFCLCRWIFVVLLGMSFLTALAIADDESTLVELMRDGQLKRAMSIADQRLAKNPRDAGMLFLKALLQQKSGKHGDAILTYQRLIRDHPTLPEPYHNLAILYAGRGRFAEARSALEQAARASRSLANIHEKLGDVYAHLAMQTYRRALLPQDPGLAQISAAAPIQQLILKPAPAGAAESGAAQSRGSKRN